MQKIIRITCLLSFLLLSQWTLDAQRPHHGPRHHGMALEHMAEALELSAEQQTQLKALHKEQKEAHQALREQSFDTPEARHEARAELRRQHQEAMEAILTDAQRLRLQELKEEHAAERRERGKEGAEKRKKMHEDMKAYRETNIIPVLRAQRTKLEAQLSEEDKVTIQAIRAQKQQMKADLEKMTKEERHALKKSGEAGKAHREQMHQLLQKYEDEINTLFAELEDERQTWKADLQKIAETHHPEGVEKPARKLRRQKMEGEKRSRNSDEKTNEQHHRKLKRHHKAIMGKAGFLLLEPQTAEVTPPTDAPAAGAATLRVFPNPSAAQNTVELNINQPGQYRLEVYNQEGQFQQLITEGYRQAGTYRENISLTDLPAGTYYVRLSGAAGVISQPLVITK